MGAGGGVNSQLCRASITGGGAAPPVRAAQQASAVACSACVPLAAPGRSGGRARGGTGLGAGLAPLRLHLQVLRVDRALASSQLPRLQGVDVAAAVPPQPAEPRGAGPLCAGAAEARGTARRVRRAPRSPEGPPAPGTTRTTLRTATWDSGSKTQREFKKGCSLPSGTKLSKGFTTFGTLNFTRFGTLVYRVWYLIISSLLVFT